MNGKDMQTASLPQLLLASALAMGKNLVAFTVLHNEGACYRIEDAFGDIGLSEEDMTRLEDAEFVIMRQEEAPDFLKDVKAISRIHELKGFDMLTVSYIQTDVIARKVYSAEFSRRVTTREETASYWINL